MGEDDIECLKMEKEAQRYMIERMQVMLGKEHSEVERLRAREAEAREIIGDLLGRVDWEVYGEDAVSPQGRALGWLKEGRE